MDFMSKINDIIIELKKDPNVLAVYLFGSYALNNSKPYSDIDICIFLKDYSKSLTYYGFAGKYVDISVFNNLPLTVKYKVFKEGKSLYVSDGLELKNILRVTLRDYLDNKHRFDYQLNYFLNKESVSL